MNRFGYRPYGMALWDTWYIEHDGAAHVFYLQRHLPGSGRPESDAHNIGHAISRDLIHWEERPPALWPGPAGGLDDLQHFTGCATKHDGRFYLYYTMRSSTNQAKKQHIGLATSENLETWERYSGNPVISPDPRWYVSHDNPLPCGVVDCRDLVVVRHPDEDVWLGFYAAMKHAEELAEGAAIAAVRSSDLLHWEHLPPAFTPKKYNVMEVPDVFCIDGRWYLTCLVGHGLGNRGIFSDPHVAIGTIYAVADRPEGPYHELEDDQILIGGINDSGYSCRSLEFEGERMMFYTQRITDGSVLSPPMRVITTDEGHLRLAWSPRTSAYRQKELISLGEAPLIVSLPSGRNNWEQPTGRWRIEGNRYIGESRTGWQVADLGLGSADVEVEARITLHDAAAAGLVWRTDASKPFSSESDMVFLLEGRDQCLRAAHLNLFEDSTVRCWPLEMGRPYHLRVCIRRPWIEIYVGDLLVLQCSTEMAEPRRPSVGLFVDRGRAELTDIAVYALSDQVM